ncbi:PPPDE peptidase family deubiquitinase/desumoylase Sdu1 [Schizosaccharomyces osmophilus]|uniref:PPPDE peptidase family deubiquitinase/desumoylase Sdu1 n=1 Tax=Schizosaccharomyces osmophilus TaxID=2545709 RepID=A0AAE9WET5_9SCHI|nr:PPPDE peptidase family deubiquitinase/desumoylase Sdu1 [Schizosaccharomyces osmophilus]WBW73941.1 PPPDE peptidase family deubiquitinase/desumoylase Sdu1 [Schizosaccharomyces osmophilus]
MEAYINVYDLMQNFPLSRVAWTLGLGIYHTGFVLEGKEYAYGAHAIPNATGVFVTVPKPPLEGCRWRCSIPLPPCKLTKFEIDEIITRLSKEFTGTSYSLLSQNCNHFTDAIAKALTNTTIPAFLNRLSKIGLTFPSITNAVLQLDFSKAPTQNSLERTNSTDSDEEVLVPPSAKLQQISFPKIPKVVVSPPTVNTDNLVTESRRY